MHFESTAELVSGLSVLALLLQGQAEIAQGFRIIGLETQRHAATAGRAFELTQGPIGLRQIRMVARLVWAERDGPPDQLHCPSMVALLMAQHTQKVQGVGVLGIVGQKLLIKLRSVAQLPGSMHFNGGGQLVLHGCLIRDVWDRTWLDVPFTDRWLHHWTRAPGKWFRWANPLSIPLYYWNATENLAKAGRATDSMMHSSLRRSLEYCEALTRREAGNFYPAFRVLPRSQRLALCAVYTFMRIADDLSDEPGVIAVEARRICPPGEKAWKRHWLVGLATLSHWALAHTIGRYGIPRAYFEAVLDGVEMDLEPTCYHTFADLRLYCYRVASVVGLACIHIWGFSRPHAKIFAEKAGIAFQLTNILRDLAEDAARGRIYLPREDLDRFGYTPEELATRPAR